ncbi:TIGR04255 family protein [Vibrio fluvialis]
MRIDYAIAVMQIADLSDTEIKAAGELIHSELKEDFPYIVELQMNDVSVSVDSSGQATTKVKTLPTYHRVNDDRTDTISIAKSQIAFHTVKFVDIDSFIADAHSAIERTATALDVRKFGRISIRFITNFALDESTHNSFVEFNADKYLAPTLSTSSVKGPSIFESWSRNDDTGIESRVVVSVLFKSMKFPDELMDTAVATFDISREQSGVCARIDIDSLWNRQGKLIKMESGVFLETLSSVGKCITDIYTEIQGE